MAQGAPPVCAKDIRKLRLVRPSSPTGMRNGRGSEIQVAQNQIANIGQRSPHPASNPPVPAALWRTPFRKYLDQPNPRAARASSLATTLPPHVSPLSFPHNPDQTPLVALSWQATLPVRPRYDDDNSNRGRSRTVHHHHAPPAALTGGGSGELGQWHGNGQDTQIQRRRRPQRRPWNLRRLVPTFANRQSRFIPRCAISSVCSHSRPCARRWQPPTQRRPDAPVRAAIYARYSSDLQSAASITDQVRVGRSLCADRGWRVVEVFTDEAMSGASHLRPGFQAMQQAAMNGQFDIIVAEALDRLSRDQEHIAALHKRMSFLDVSVVTKAEGEINEMHIGLGGTMSALWQPRLRRRRSRPS
ncbi:recombinase family protein [Salipiger thiooxidans]|nr:recombinase family protein [Salipiger thiooxidans]